MSPPDDMICYCGGVTRASILEAIMNGATTLADIQRMTGAGIGSRCKELNPKGVCCHADILKILQDVRVASSVSQPGGSCCGGSGCAC